MKKILLATTVLAMTATVAAAEVAVSGAARMGLVFDGNTVGANTSKAKFTSRVRVSFSMSGETDNGLSFGASVRNDQSGQGNTANGDSTVFISGAFGKLTFGDNDSAANALVGNVAAKSLTGLGDNNELGYLGQTDTSVLYTYSAGALSVALSAGQLGTTATATANEDAMSVAVKYTADAFYAALGYESAKVGVAAVSDNQLSVGLGATFSGVDLSLVAMDRKSNADTHYAVSATYSMDALGLTAFYADKGPSNAYGIGASYDLGGGASVVGGIQKVKGLKAVADVGVNMSF
jgi:outer membrane protein OmpU